MAGSLRVLSKRDNLLDPLREVELLFREEKFPTTSLLRIVQLLPSFPTAYKQTYVNLIEHGSFEIMAIAFRWRLALSRVKSDEDLYALLYSQDSWGNKINITLKYFEDFLPQKPIINYSRSLMSNYFNVFEAISSTKMVILCIITKRSIIL